MTDPWNAPQPGQPPQYGPPPTEYTQWMPMGDGPPGRIRPTGKVILLCVVTLGIYVFVYNYQVHDEMKRHSYRGLGGGIALLLTFVANVAMPFVTPSEVGNLYVRKGRKAPVTGWTGLWFLLPSVLGYAIFLVALFAGSGPVFTTTTPGNGVSGTERTQFNDSFGAAFGIAFLIYGLVVVAGAITWTIKTNGALNAYWETLQRGGFNAPAPTG